MDGTARAAEVWQQLKAQAAALPECPGVYLMRDGDNRLIYVGKARQLRNRVRSYFQSPERLAPKVAAMMRRVRALEYIATDTEVEALILEATLVKQHQPRYNIRLKDDKAYPYLRLSWEEEFPRLLIARRPRDDGSRYFGPYTRAQSVHEAIRLLRKIFPIRNCSDHKFRNAPRPCLEYHIRRCEAPCQGWVDRARYRATMERVEMFLDGKTEEVEHQLLTEMERAAAAMEFERAARLRDQVRAVREVTAQQKVSSQAGHDLDAIAWAVEQTEAFVQVFRVREGRLVGREALTVTGLDGATGEGEIAEAFLPQYYERTQDIPPDILVAALPADVAWLSAWLEQKRGGKVRLLVPKRGEKARLLAMVAQNARLSRDDANRRQEAGAARRQEGLAGIQAALGLPAWPHRMECYDISNTQGSESVASMVVFTEGKPDPSQYRRFRIREVEGPNDFASMAEVIRRRFRRARQEEETAGEAGRFARRPDLILIDGGLGQLHAAVDAMRQEGVEVPVFGLAKQHEWLFQPESSEPIVLDRSSPALQLLQHLRDEAHRFAVTYHRALRTRRNLRSRLDGVPGIGPKRKKILLRHYSDLEAVARAPVEELAALPGMTRRAAEAVKAYLAGQRQEAARHG